MSIEASAAPRTGVALALSGGGFRATLFHLGALRRLNELGALGAITAIASVSGGSIMAAVLAEALMRAPLGYGRLADFEALARTVHDLTTCNLRRRVFLARLLPQNWRSSLAKLVAKELAARVTARTLADLPASPRFIFCATDMVFGVNWTYERDAAGDYQAGYRRTRMDEISIAYATAASACFPPLFAPLPPLVAPDELTGGHARGADAALCRTRIGLTDGAVYDNMGIEPLWKWAATLLVSDAGGAFELSPSRGTLNDLKRYPDIIGNQARALRKRWLIESYRSGVGPGGAPGFGGAYWGAVSNRSHYRKSDSLGYSERVTARIARIRTDLDAFSEAETAVLENHGYLLADIALQVHVPALYPKDAPPMAVPYPDWMGPDEKILKALEGSSRRRLGA